MQKCMRGSNQERKAASTQAAGGFHLGCDINVHGCKIPNCPISAITDVAKLLAVQGPQICDCLCLHECCDFAIFHSKHEAMVPATVNVCLHGAIWATSLASHHSPLNAGRYSDFDVGNLRQVTYDQDGVEKRNACVLLVVFAPIIHLYVIAVIHFDELDCFADLGSLLGQIHKARFCFHIAIRCYWTDFGVDAKIPRNPSAPDQVAGSFDISFRHTELHRSACKAAAVATQVAPSA